MHVWAKSEECRGSRSYARNRRSNWKITPKDQLSVKNLGWNLRAVWRFIWDGGLVSSVVFQISYSFLSWSSRVHLQSLERTWQHGGQKDFERLCTRSPHGDIEWNWRSGFREDLPKVQTTSARAGLHCAWFCLGAECELSFCGPRTQNYANEPNLGNNPMPPTGCDFIMEWGENLSDVMYTTIESKAQIVM